MPTHEPDEITGTEDVLDSRNIEERIGYLEAERDTWESASFGSSEEATEELNALLELRDQCNDSSWKFGMGFIRDSYFREHAEETADSIGAIDVRATWPLNHIDWEAAATELKGDYTSYTIRGEEYWSRD